MSEIHIDVSSHFDGVYLPGSRSSLNSDELSRAKMSMSNLAIIESEDEYVESCE